VNKIQISFIKASWKYSIIFYAEFLHIIYCSQRVRGKDVNLRLYGAEDTCDRILTSCGCRASTFLASSTPMLFLRGTAAKDKVPFGSPCSCGQDTCREKGRDSAGLESLLLI
jgi:hypothetical protein